MKRLLTYLLVGIAACPALAWTPTTRAISGPPEFLAAGLEAQALGLVAPPIGRNLGHIDLNCGYPPPTSNRVRTGCTWYPDRAGNPNPGLYTIVYVRTDHWYELSVIEHELHHVGAHRLGTEWVH